MRPTFILAVAVCSCVAVVTPLLNDQLPDAAPAATVAPAAITATGALIFAHGYVEGLTREVELRFEGAGQVRSIEVREGDVVREGDPLAKLDTAILQFQREEAEAHLALVIAERLRLVNAARPEAIAVADAEIAVAEARLDQARRRLERAEPLADTDAISEDTYDQIRADFVRSTAELELARRKAAEIAAEARDDEIQMADAKIEMAQARVRLAQELLEKATLKAPCDGVILKVDAEPGEVITLETDYVPPVITLIDDRQLRVRAFVEELDAVRVRPGMAAKLTADGLPDQPMYGHVLSCAPGMIPKRHFSNRPNERVDVKVREVIIALDQATTSDVVIGLPVDVYLSPTAAARTDS